MFEDLDIEQIVIGAVLIRNSNLAKIPDLKPGHFAFPVHGRIFGACREMWQDGRTANPVTLKAAFEADPELAEVGGAAYLGKCAAAAGLIANVKDYAAGVIDLHGRRELYRACNETIATLQHGTVLDNPVTALAAGMASTIDSVINQQIGNQIKTCAEVVEEIILDADKTGEPISTGYPRLDQAMDGGLLRGKLYAFMARQKTGKTLLLGSLAFNMAMSGKRVLFIAAEMGAQEIELRNLARVMHEKQGIIRKEASESDQMKDRMRKWAVKMGDMLLYQSAPGLTLSRLKTIIESAVYLNKIDAFVLDYWQLVTSDDSRKNKTQHLDEVAQWLAAAVKRHTIVGIVAGQTNREGQMRDGDGLANACDLCMEIQRPEEHTLPERWFEMRQSRYTRWRDVGGADFPSYRINEYGSHLEELPA